MPKRLVIVESPAKASTIEKILGADYTVQASMGHVRDLPRSKESVDVENGFMPVYEVIKDKKKVITSLRKAAKEADEIILAADPDREGEAICWHLAEELKTTKKPIRRVTFNEITPDAISAAMQQPREIDQPRVDAQQARRVLDRLVGYRISPLLWRNVQKGLSAGRVQSVAVRLVCERETAIRAFNPEEYWTVAATVDGDTNMKFDARLYRIGEEKPGFGSYGFGIDSTRAEEVATDLRAQSFVVDSVKKRQQKQSPKAPFITSTLQQEAARRLRTTARQTMAVAQQLYEGDPDRDLVGLITYMRTDSVRVSQDAIDEAREFIGGRYGADYVPAKPRTFRTKKSAQDAHEAIRPTSVERTPESLKGALTDEQLKLYDIIWKRFVASQVSDAILDLTTIDIHAGDYKLRASGSIVRFPGFRDVFMETAEDVSAQSAAEEDTKQPLPDVKDGEALNLHELTPGQHFTEPPPRYSEASLIRELEERGIGRPSTYASIMSTIQNRKYVDRISSRFHPTEVGEMVTKMLVRSFPDILDIDFTAKMESDLDEVEEGGRNWVQVMEDFYGPFTEALEGAADKMYEEKKSVEEITDKECEECGLPMAIKWGRYGKFLGCTGYPDCKTTQPLDGKKAAEPIKTGVACPECDSGELLERKSRRGKVFYGCSEYPTCKTAVWDPPVSGMPCPECEAPFLTHRVTKTRHYYLCYRRDECGYKSDPEPVTEENPAPTHGIPPAEQATADA
ncbi:type I DNA topoisomerase [Candidatus Poribacteria bacterium]|jgi:DNA topoisomerase I|nr:type I DNA topoisomerase [Candidatus Poribacteria bacterium]MBT5535610.1 type I DNA topoisomerase [Candidatus Poribacteria bacterium]MBT5713459.1 type I DNA topoisomerase [Candidatus Poribacteria bacterium]MBT7095855.1 type I DNA topoisomerase [Candidatus Poribacteria bacterium]MBT7805442.1 type I DNA topoisomerase [Candidatus Poribacteria bacterium]